MDVQLVPAERAHRRIIDGEKVCRAIEGLGDPGVVQAWARRFSVLADPTRLRLLICIHAAELISVSDLAVAADLNEDTVSQTLRCLRANQTVFTERDGRVIRYRLGDDVIQELLERVGSSISE